MDRLDLGLRGRRVIKGMFGSSLWICLMAGCGAGSQPECDAHADCQQTEACVEEQCVEVDPLEIFADSLPRGVVGVAYNATVEARGGVGEKTWGLEFAPTWIAIEANAGVLKGTPQEADPGGTVIQIYVKDEQGSRDLQDLQLVVTACSPGQKYSCHGDQDGACFLGERTCGSDGKPGPCALGSTPSQDASVCGPGCGVCDPALAPDCVDGVCQCGRAGQGEACEGTRVCCGGQCVDLQGDRDHCGRCDRQCDDPVEWYDTRACKQGSCELVSCDDGWANCDPLVLGCETRLGTQGNCEQCGHECGSGQICVNQKCVEGCSVDFLCDAQGWNCGIHSTAECGTVDCGDCDGYQQCSEGVCECLPDGQICKLNNMNCDSISTPDCGTVSCGNCSLVLKCEYGGGWVECPQVCMDGRCDVDDSCPCK